MTKFCKKKKKKVAIDNKYWRGCGEKKEPLDTVGSSADEYSHCGNQSGDSQKRKQNDHMTHSWTYTQRTP